MLAWVLLGGGAWAVWRYIVSIPPAGLASNYKVFWGAIRQASSKYGIPIPVLYGVLSRESNGKFVSVGADGHGRGPWQIDDRYHAKWLATHNPLDPYESTDYAAQLLKQNLDYFKGHLRAAIAAYNAGPGRVSPSNPDVNTTGKDYSADVIRRANEFAAQIGTSAVA